MAMYASLLGAGFGNYNDAAIVATGASTRSTRWANASLTSTSGDSRNSRESAGPPQDSARDLCGRSTTQRPAYLLTT